MTDGVRGWLLEVITVSILCAAADGLMPPGGVKQAGKLVFGALLICVVIAPLARWEFWEGEDWLREYHNQLEQATSDLNERAMNYERAVIEGKYAAYIADKAAGLGATCQVEVVCEQRENLWLPVFVRLRGEMNDEVKEEFSAWLHRELDVPAERQYFERTEEEVT